VTDMPGLDLVPQDMVRVKSMTSDTKTLGFDHRPPFILV